MFKREYLRGNFILGSSIVGSLGIGLFHATFRFHNIISILCLWVACVDYIEHWQGIEKNRPSPFFSYFKAFNLIVVNILFGWAFLLGVRYHLWLSAGLLILLIANIGFGIRWYMGSYFKHFIKRKEDNF